MRNTSQKISAQAKMPDLSKFKTTSFTLSFIYFKEAHLQ